MSVAGETKYSVHPRAAHRQVAGEVFVITEDRAFHRLATPTAVDLFQALVRGPATQQELVDLLSRRYQVQPDQAQADVTSFLRSLVDRRVLVASGDPADATR